MREQGGILTRLEMWARRHYATSPNRSLAAAGFLLIPSPLYVFIVGCALYDLKAASPATKSLLNSSAFSVFDIVLMAIAIGGPIGGIALVVFSAGRAYLDYRKREPAFHKPGTPRESN